MIILILIRITLINDSVRFSGDVLGMAGRGNVKTPKFDRIAVSGKESDNSLPCQTEGVSACL